MLILVLFFLHRDFIMATIKFSNAFLYNIYDSTTSGLRTSNWWFGVYKGTIPSSSELSTGTRAYNFRTSDILIPWDGRPASNYASYSNGLLTFNPTGPISIQTATASGTASWFFYMGGTVSVYSMDECSVVAGTISGPGGGGDLIIGDVNVVSGKSYILQNFVMAFPLTF